MKHFFVSCYLDSPLQEGRIFDVFEPEAITRETALFFVHGGGWSAGSRIKYHKIMEAFNERGYLCASTDYRLKGVTVFEQLQDIREAYDRFVTLLKQKNRPLKIASLGSSAGAHLASLLLCAAPGECGEKCVLKNDWVKPACGILLATPHDFLPWDGMMPQMWAGMQAVAGAPYDLDPDRYERLSLKNYIRPDNPPLFFAEAELEHLFFSEYTLEFVKKHREWGIPSHWKVYSRMEHGFFYELVRKAQLEAFDDICRFLEGNLKTI
ncbi:MAG: alpha/beta hydrolase [Lentisphaeria bacterium]|nr:alpha/beta hydrolase [Lentisphaeria bacterium]